MENCITQVKKKRTPYGDMILLGKVLDIPPATAKQRVNRGDATAIRILDEIQANRKNLLAVLTVKYNQQ